jgi:HSP20 family molecular chaperone IbpA
MGTPDLKDREDHIEVKQANHDNGLLQIDVDRKIGKR